MTLFPGLDLPVFYFPPEDANDMALIKLGLKSEDTNEEDLVQRICTFYTIHQIAPRHVYDEEGNFKYPNHSVLHYSGSDECIVPMSPEALNTLIMEHVLASINSQSLNSEEDGE